MPNTTRVQRPEELEHQDNVILLNQEEEQQEPPESAAGLTGLIDMRNRLNTLEKGGTGSQNSQKFDAVTTCINGVGSALANNELTGNQAADEAAWELITARYAALFMACEAYTDRWHVFTQKGKARQAQVKEILETAKKEYQALGQWPSVMEWYSEEDRAQVTWADVLDEGKASAPIFMHAREYPVRTAPAYDHDTPLFVQRNEDFEYYTNTAAGNQNSIGGIPTPQYILETATGGEIKTLRIKKAFRAALAAIRSYQQTMTTVGCFATAPVREDFDSDENFAVAFRQFQAETNLNDLAGEAIERLHAAVAAIDAALFANAATTAEPEEHHIAGQFKAIVLYSAQIENQINKLLDPVDSTEEKKGTMRTILEKELVDEYSLNTALLYQTARPGETAPLVGYGTEWEDLEALTQKENPTEAESKGAYSPMALKQKQTLTPQQRSYINDYIADSRGINAQMRGTSTYDAETTQAYQHRINTISQWLPKLETDLNVYRGVSDVALIPLLRSIPESKEAITKEGFVNHTFLAQNKSKLVGLEFTDRAFGSTTLVKQFAQEWASKIPGRDHRTLNEKYLRETYGDEARELFKQEKPEEYEKIKEDPDKMQQKILSFSRMLADQDTKNGKTETTDEIAKNDSIEIQSHLYEIRVPKGAKAGFIDLARMRATGEDSDAKQYEVLLDQNTRYKIVDIVNQQNDSGEDIPNRYKFVIEVVMDTD